MTHDAQPISNKRVALLVEQGFDDGELFGTLEGLQAAGAEVAIVGPTAPTEFAGSDGGVVTSTLAAGRASRLASRSRTVPAVTGQCGSAVAGDRLRPAPFPGAEDDDLRGGRRARLAPRSDRTTPF